MPRSTLAINANAQANVHSSLIINLEGAAVTGASNGLPRAGCGQLGPVFSWARISIFAGILKSKSERIGISWRTLFRWALRSARAVEPG
jgi:hypothetical protein